MTAKGYAFCLLMAIVAVLAWLRPVTPAQAAVQPTYEYAIVPVQVGTDKLLEVLNAQGAKGWRTAGGACVKVVSYGGSFCDNTLLVRERR